VDATTTCLLLEIRCCYGGLEMALAAATAAASCSCCPAATADSGVTAMAAVFGDGLLPLLLLALAILEG